MTESFPLPNANPEYVMKVQTFYRDQFHVELSYAEAKEFLERVMQFYYLAHIHTPIQDALHEGKPISRGTGDLPQPLI